MLRDLESEFEKLKQFKTKDEYIEELVKIIKHLLYNRYSYVKNSSNDFKREEFYELLKNKIGELYDSLPDKTSIEKDIVFVGAGHTTIALKIGDNVLKVGKTDNNYGWGRKMDFDCLLPSYINEIYKVDTEEYYTINYSPFVDTKSVSEDDLYPAYKRLRVLGYIWNDPRIENIGRIIKDITVNGIAYKKGDIVIVDLEDLAYVGEFIPDDVLDEISISSYNANVYTFETRYIKEAGMGLK